VAQDRVAGLYYRRGQIEETLEVLERWRQSHPHDPLPLARRGLVLHGLGEQDAALDHLLQAQGLAHGPLRGKLSYLAAQLTLRQPTAEGEAGPDQRLQKAREFLESCLSDNPEHQQALWNLAAVRWLLGDVAGLAALASSLDQGETSEPVSLYFAALARFAAGDHARTVDLCGQIGRASSPRAETIAAGSPERNGAPTDAAHIDWTVEAAYLQSLAELSREEPEQAADDLKTVAAAADSPSCGHAQGLLGNLAYAKGSYEEASRWWQSLEQRKRSAWKIGEALGGAVFLTALEAMHEGRFESAADKLRAAGKLGCRDRRLGQLLLLTLFRAGQKVVYG
jgi:tetratricopeptide (TPR) repeat protein